MIQHNTARRLMYDWHAGQWSALYAAASSGLVASFVALSDEVATITDPADRAALMGWLTRRAMAAPEVIAGARAYRVLPWASRS